MKNKEISIIYIYYNTPTEIKNSLASIKNAIGNITYEIIIIDNHSSEFLKNNNKNIRIIRNKSNKGFGRAINQAGKLAKGNFLLLINPDTLFHKNSIFYLYQKIKNDENIGAIGPMQVSLDNSMLPSINGYPTILKSIFSFSILNILFKNNSFSRAYWLPGVQGTKQLVVPVIGGACMLIPKKIFNQVNGFDEKFFMYFEESDLCKRINQLGYKIIYYPKAKITHLVGMSNKDKTSIESIFEKSRYYYLKKNYGNTKALLAEGFIRSTKSNNILLVLILLISLFLNLYKISTQLMFFGDFGRDYLVARDMVINHTIPLIGIESSVKWLHQGPLSIYFIALSFLIGNFSPIAPAIFYGIVGSLTTLLVYILGKNLCNSKVGLLASLFYATSPLITVSMRMPYHTSSIPFFACLFFISMFKVIKGSYKVLPIASFLLGILFLLELSNGVLFLLFLIYIYWYKLRFPKNIINKSIFTFILGISPFILYDLMHHFIQIGGFILWVINRTRLFFGLTTNGNETTLHAGSAILTIWQELNRIFFPINHILADVLLLSIIFIVFKLRKEILFKKDTIIIPIIWLFVPLTAYVIHSAPGTAYFPLLFPSISLLLGYSIYYYSKISKIVILFFITICLINGVYTIYNHYFLDSSSFIGSNAPGWNYGMGISIDEQEIIANKVVTDADHNAFQFTGGKDVATFPSDLDNYKYLIIYHHGLLNNNAKLTYTLYRASTKIKTNQHIIFKTKFYTLTKYERT